MFQTSIRGMVVALLILTIGGGCNTITRRAPRMPWQDKDEEEYGEPAKLVAIWKDQVMVPPGGRATRGFGGRVYFYDAAQKPVRVRGTFTVYAYDDDAAETRTTNKPDRKFVFQECDLQEHYSMSKIGHSYSFWIPWDAVGGEQRSISLAPFFNSENGSIVAGEQSRSLLLGQIKNEEEIPPAEAIPAGQPVIQYGAQPASYVPPQQQAPQQGYVQPGLDRTQLRTTTIPVPSTLEQRLLMRNDSGMIRRTSAEQAYPAPVQQPVSQPQPGGYYQPAAAQYPPAQQYPAAQPQPVGQPYPAVQQQLPAQQYPAAQQQYPAAQQPAARQRTVGVQQYQDWQREGAGGMRAGINIRNFRPEFHDSQKFGEYLATGRMPTEEGAAVQPATHSLPQQPQAPSSQTVPPQYGGPLNQPYQSTWPPVHPSLQSR